MRHEFWQIDGRVAGINANTQTLLHRRELLGLMAIALVRAIELEPDSYRVEAYTERSLGARPQLDCLLVTECKAHKALLI